MKKMSNAVKCLVAMFVMVAAFCTTGMTAKAAVTVQQTDAGETGVKVQWNAFTGAKYYGVQISDSPTFANIINKGCTNSTTTSKNFNNLAPGSSYYVRVGYGPNSNECYSNFSTPIEVVTAPSKTTSAKFTGADDTTATIEYAPCAGATGYDIKYNDEVTSTTATVYKVALMDGAGSWVEVYPYRTSSTGFKAVGSKAYISSVSRLTTTISKDNFGITNAYTNINTFYFAALGYGDGVDLEAVPVSGKGKIEATGNLNSTLAIRIENKFKKGVMYKYRVRAYIVTSDNQKVYGNWSAYRYMINTKESKYKQSGKKIKLQWGKLKGCSKVKVQIATSENGKYKTCSVLKSSKKSYTITKCGKKALKKGKTYWVKILYTTKGGTSDIYGSASVKIR